MSVGVKMESSEDHMATTEDQIKPKFHKMESTILDSFTKLTTKSDRERIVGGSLLLKHLSESNEIEKFEKEFNYVLDRLIRGIGTSRLDARKGFYSTLVGLLVTYEDKISCSKILEVMKKHLSTSKSISKSERADVYMGQILTIGALIRSGLFEKIPTDEQKELFEKLIFLANRRIFLSLPAYSFIITYIEKISDEIFLNTIWSAIQPEITKSLSELNLDQVWFLLIARDKFPNIIKHKTLRNLIGYPEILHEDSITDLCKLLINPTTLINGEHPLYHTLCTKLASSNLLPKFCTELNSVLNGFNRNRFIVTLTIIADIITHLSDDNISEIPELLLPNVLQECVKIFPNIKHKKDDDICIKFNELFTNLNTKLSEHDNAVVKLEVMKRVLFYPGTFLFEKLTGAKIVQQITSSLPTDGVKQLAELYKSVILAENKKQVAFNLEQNWLNVERLQAANMFNRLLAHSQVVNEHNWRFEQVKFLLDSSLFKTENENMIGVELAGSLKEIFYHSLDQKLPKLIDVRNLLSQLVNYVNTKISDPQTLRNPINEEQLTHWNKMFKLVTKLEKKSESNDIQVVFHTLLMQMGLQLFSEKKLAMNTLEELHSCYKRVKSKKETEVLVEGSEGSEPLWIEVIVDLFLNLLSQNNHLYRRIVGYVFPYLCPYLTVTAIHQILSVLDPSNNNHPFMDQDDEDDDESDDENAESGEDSAEQSDLSDIDDYEDEPVNDKLRMAIRQALGRTPGAQTDDEESVDMDNMDEEEGKRLDKALAEAFRSIKGPSNKKSKKQSKEDKTLTHFRVRVLDLIELYIDSEQSSLENILEIMIPLLQTLEFSIKEQHQQPLEHRIRACLTKLTKVKKFSNTDNVTEDTLIQLLNSFLDKGNKSTVLFKDIGDIITKCCVFIIRTSEVIPQSKTSSISNLINDSLSTFFEKRDCSLPSILFTEILQLNWSPNWTLIPKLIEYAFDSKIRPFRRNQALTLLITFYKNHRFFTQTDMKVTKKNCNKIEKNLFDESMQLLKNCESEQSGFVKEKFICLLMTLLFTINSCHKACKIESSINWKELGEALCDYRNRVTLAKDGKKAFNKLCTVLGIEVVTKPQQKKVQAVVQNGENGVESEHDSDNQEDDEVKRKENKRRQKSKSKRNNVQQLKKQSKMLRMQQSVDDDISFSKLVDVNDMEVSDEDSNKKSIQTNGVGVENGHVTKSKKEKRKHVINGNVDDESLAVTKHKSKKKKIDSN